MAWARLTDKIGRRTVYLWACAFAIPFGVLMFLLVNTGIFLLIIATFVMAYCRGARTRWPAPRAPGSPSCSRRTPARREPHWPTRSRRWCPGSPRSSPRCCSSPSAGSGPALLFSSYAAIGLVAALVTRETWGPRERQLADEAAAAEPPPSTIHASRLVRRSR